MQEESDWLIALGEDRNVTVWLRSGRQVTGIIEDQFPAGTRDATVFRIKNAYSIPKGVELPQGVSPPEPKGQYVLVSVKEIELIDVNDSEAAVTTANETPAGQDRPAGGP